MRKPNINKKSAYLLVNRIMNEKIKIGTVLIMKPTTEKLLSEFPFTAMTVEGIEQDSLKMVWMTNQGKLHRESILPSNLWHLEDIKE